MKKFAKKKEIEISEKKIQELTNEEQSLLTGGFGILYGILLPLPVIISWLLKK